jgi:DNA-binding NtrC family response regulator
MADSGERNVRSLFLVDDEPMVLRALERTLRQQGYEIRSFPGAEEALIALDADRPDCIVSDYYMPRTDGLDFLERVGELHPQIGRVLLTGGHIDDRVRTALQKQVINVLMQKPWHIDSIREVMEHIRAGRSGIFIETHVYGEGQDAKRHEDNAGQERKREPAAGPAVLVVDNDEEFLRMLEIRLNRLGCKVYRSETAEHALEAAREIRPDVVLVDLTLPGTGGPQLIAGLGAYLQRRPRSRRGSIPSGGDWRSA